MARLVLTASGGPFLGRSRAELADVTPDQALAHPNWTYVALIAVGSAKRLPNRPETPTIAETLPAIPRALGFFAVMGPPGTPESIARKTSDDLRALLSEPATQKRFGENHAPAPPSDRNSGRLTNDPG